MNKEFSAFWDMSRWVAAFMVLIAHVRHYVLADYGEIEHPDFFIKVAYFFTDLGHERVMVFFVISGFLVGGMTWRRWRVGALIRNGDNSSDIKNRLKAVGRCRR